MNTVWMSTKKGLVTGFLLLVFTAIIGVPANWLDATTSPARAQVATLPASGQQDIRTFPSVHDQTEISIDVSSANPRHLFISCQIFGTVQGWFFSTDGGMNWTGSESPPPGLPLSSVGGDPVAVFDGSDIAYWVSLGTSSAGGI